jgi:hypothetical protein
MLRGSIFFILGKRDDVRDAEGWILILISVRLNLVKEEMKFEMGLLLGFEKKIDRLTFINEKNLVGSKNCCKFAL